MKKDVNSSQKWLKRHQNSMQRNEYAFDFVEKSKNLTVVPRTKNIPFIMKQMVYCKVRKDM